MATVIRFTLLLAAVLVSLPLYGQVAIPFTPPDGPLGVVDTVILGGNVKTKPYVILDEMTLRSGDTVTYEAMEYDRNRIYSLGLFTRVDIQYDSLQNTRFLYVDVSERWYLLPFPVFGFRDGDPKRPYFGAGVLHNNVGGRNQKLYGSLVFGYDPSASISFNDPLFDHENRLFAGGSFSFSRVRNKSEIEAQRTGDFDELHYDASATLGKRFSLTQASGITLGFQSVEVSSWYPGRTVSLKGRDRFLFATLSYAFDSRDLSEYASRGSYAGLYATKYGFGESAVQYTRLGADLRRYTPLPFGITLASRLAGSIVGGGAVPTYNHVFFGYHERIRGWFSTVTEGENYGIFGVELRRYILPPRVFRVSGLPVPEEFSVWRFGISLALFANTGAIWYRGDTLAWNSLASGYGGGIHFLLPYGFIVRTEYAWNQFGKGQFIIDFRGAI